MMNNKYLIVSKYFVKNSIDEMYGDQRVSPFMVNLFLFIIFAALSLPICALIKYVYPSLEQLNQQGMILSMLLFLGSSILLFFALFTVMNIFYFADDIEQILPLPLSGRHIVVGKFIAVYLNMLVYSGIILIPLIYYGVKSNANIAYFLFSVIAILIEPLLPIILGSILCIGLMRISNILKHKDLFKIISSSMAIVIILVINFFANKNNVVNDDKQLVELLLKGNNSGMSLLQGIFFTNKFLSKALLNSSDFKGVINLLIMVGICISLIVLFYIFCGGIYLKSILGISENYSSQKIYKIRDRIKEASEPKSVVSTLVFKDIKLILRTPQFFMNCIAMLLYVPAILGIIVATNGGINSFLSIFDNYKKLGSCVIAMSFLVTVLCISTSGAGYSALSREGKDFVFLKHMPVNHNQKLKAKIISSLCINNIVSIILIVFILSININVLDKILGMIIVIETVVLVTYTGMLADYKKPRLTWEDERDMFKGNLMPVIIMLVFIFIGTIACYASYKIANDLLIFFILFIAELFCIVVFNNRLYSLADKVYNE